MNYEDEIYNLAMSYNFVAEDITARVGVLHSSFSYLRNRQDIIGYKVYPIHDTRTHRLPILSGVLYIKVNAC